MKKIACFAAAAAVSAAVTGFLIAPSIPAKRGRGFTGVYYAHRGLHDLQKGIPENSMAAFKAAADSGFGIELDVQLTRDGQIAVMHDSSLARACGVEKYVYETDADELKGMPLFGTDERVPLFKDVLTLVDGRVPILLELKTGPNKYELCDKVVSMIRFYDGPICVESFDPRILYRLRRIAPEFFRGQLTASAKTIGGKAGFALSRVLCNFLSRPDFIAHSCEKKSLFVRLCESMGAKRFVWTVREPGHEAGNDSVIFEGFIPEGKPEG